MQKTPNTLSLGLLHFSIILALLAACLHTPALAADNPRKEDLIVCGNNSKDIPPALVSLYFAYKNQFKCLTDNYLVLKNGEKIPYRIFEDNRCFEQKLDNPDLKDQMSIHYPLGDNYTLPLSLNFDPGRIRFDPFFKAMYGDSRQTARANLVTFKWMPKSTRNKTSFTSVNNAHLALMAVSDELDKLPPKSKKYVSRIQTFNWRKIAGSDRQSTHSYGIAVDLVVKYSDYWRWSKLSNINYKNRIPMEIVKIFEKHGFIWGGKWYHYDTGHFEYRPELTLNLNDLGINIVHLPDE